MQDLYPLQNEKKIKKQRKGLGTTEPRKGHFFSNIYQKRNRSKKNWKRNQNNNITFKPLLIFPFQYIAEKKLKQEYWKGNQNKNISIYRLNISIIQHNAGLQLVDFFHQWEARNILIYRDIMLIYQDL